MRLNLIELCFRLVKYNQKDTQCNDEWQRMSFKDLSFIFFKSTLSFNAIALVTPTKALLILNY